MCTLVMSVTLTRQCHPGRPRHLSWRPRPRDQLSITDPYLIHILELGMMEVVSGDNWSYRSCKAPVKSSPPTNQHPVFLQAGCPSCHPTNSVKALKGKISHSMDLFMPCSPGGLPTLSLTTNSSCLPWWRVAMPLISRLMPVRPLLQ